LAVAPWMPGKIIFHTYLTTISVLLTIILLWFIRTNSMQTKSKSVLISFVTAIYFLLAATALFSHSVYSFKIATPLAEWLKAAHLENSEILVYNKRLPSLAFELNHSIISLYDGDRSLNREVQFEKDTKWRAYLYNISQENEQKRLADYLQDKESVLVLYKQTLPKKQRWLQTIYTHTKHLGPWTIHYKEEVK